MLDKTMAMGLFQSYSSGSLERNVVRRLDEVWQEPYHGWTLLPFYQSKLTIPIGLQAMSDNYVDSKWTLSMLVHLPNLNLSLNLTNFQPKSETTGTVLGWNIAVSKDK